MEAGIQFTSVKLLQASASFHQLLESTPTFSVSSLNTAVRKLAETIISLGSGCGVAEDDSSVKRKSNLLTL